MSCYTLSALAVYIEISKIPLKYLAGAALLLADVIYPLSGS
jgi:hypothetical protein